MKFRSKKDQEKFDKRKKNIITSAILLAIRVCYEIFILIQLNFVFLKKFLTLRSRGSLTARETAFRVNKLFNVKISRRRISHYRNKMGN